MLRAEKFSFRSFRGAPSIILKINPTKLSLEGGVGEGTQEDEDTQVLGLRQQHGYDEWKQTKRDTLQGGPHSSGSYVCGNT